MSKGKIISSLASIDKLIHEPARLSVMSCLSQAKEMDFLFLKAQTGLSWGNLSAHLSKLEQARYISITKTYKDKKPHTIIKLTSRGREVFLSYKREMRSFLKGL